VIISLSFLSLVVDLGLLPLVFNHVLRICVSYHLAACLVYTGEDAVEIKTEADSDDMTECPHDDQPFAGMFG